MAQHSLVPLPHPSIARCGRGRLRRLFGCGLDGSVARCDPRPRPFHFRISESSGRHHITWAVSVQRQQERRHFCSSHRNNTKPQKPHVLPSRHPLFPSPSQTLTRSTHAHAELGSSATCLHPDKQFARKYWTCPTTTPLHVHVVCVRDQYVRAWWAWRWRWWRQASVPFLLGRKM